MRISIVLFEGFELLDVFGPAELFGFIEDWEVEYLTPTLEPICSTQGARVVPDRTYADYISSGPAKDDLLLVPGGRGTRTLIDDGAFLAWLKTAGSQANTVASVCTGSALLAKAGLLEGRRATTNKRAYEWATTFGETVQWQPSARWVQDGNRWTSSGIAAGIDMAAAMIAEFKGDHERQRICQRAEIVITENSLNDPFSFSR